MFNIGDKTNLVIRYYNANYYAVAIVVVITAGIDWTAYIGGADHRLPEEEAGEYVAAFGCKLSELDAKHYFTSDLPYRN